MNFKNLDMNLLKKKRLILENLTKKWVGFREKNSLKIIISCPLLWPVRTSKWYNRSLVNF